MLQQTLPGARWLYCHPYDIDVDEPYGQAAGRGALASLMLWCNRRSMCTRMDQLLGGHAALPFEARLDTFMADATVYEPDAESTAGRYWWRGLTAFMRG